jgi:hypothetical protein
MYRGINPLLPNGGTNSVEELHPYYKAKTEANSQRKPSNFPVANSGQAPDDDNSRVFSAAQLINADQQRFYKDNQDMTRHPTRFDIQNQSLKIGGAPLAIHREVLGATRAMTTSTKYEIPLEPMADVAQLYRNPGVFDYGSAVRSHQRTEPVTFPSESIERMMRPVDEVDPGLVTNPLPDPTFMARQPMFNKQAEDAATQRWRLQTAPGMRFW